MIAGEMKKWGRNYKCDINKFWALKMVKITKKPALRDIFYLGSKMNPVVNAGCRLNTSQHEYLGERCSLSKVQSAFNLEGQGQA
jgi:hypothetical protein